MCGDVATYISGSLLVCVRCTVSDILTTVTLASTSNALPDDDVPAPKHVGVVLMSILKLFISWQIKKNFEFCVLFVRRAWNEFMLQRLCQAACFMSENTERKVDVLDIVIHLSSIQRAVTYTVLAASINKRRRIKTSYCVAHHFYVTTTCRPPLLNSGRIYEAWTKPASLKRA